jgi:hypothetical protein
VNVVRRFGCAGWLHRCLPPWRLPLRIVGCNILQQLRRCTVAAAAAGDPMAFAAAAGPTSEARLARNLGDMLHV